MLLKIFKEVLPLRKGVYEIDKNRFKEKGFTLRKGDYEKRETTTKEFALVKSKENELKRD